MEAKTGFLGGGEGLEEREEVRVWRRGGGRVGEGALIDFAISFIRTRGAFKASRLYKFRFRNGWRYLSPLKIQ